MTEIHIEPCHENWDKMAPVEKGRFCQSCSKTVVNFTESNDSEILAEYQKHNGHVCGHFKAYQIKIRLTQTLRVFLLAFLMIFCKQIIEPETLVAQTKTVQSQKEVIIKGKVTDYQSKEPLPFALIKVFGNNQLLTATYADTGGTFKINIPPQKDSVTVEVSFLSAKISETFKITNDTTTLAVTLNLEEILTWQTIVIKGKNLAVDGGMIVNVEYWVPNIRDQWKTIDRTDSGIREQLRLVPGYIDTKFW